MGWLARKPKTQANGRRTGLKVVRNLVDFCTHGVGQILTFSQDIEVVSLFGGNQTVFEQDGQQPQYKGENENLAEAGIVLRPGELGFNELDIASNPSASHRWQQYPVDGKVREVFLRGHD